MYEETISGSARFILHHGPGYRAWRAAKLRAHDAAAAVSPVEIRDPARLSPGELCRLRDALARDNLVFYACAGRVGGAELRSLGRQLGLQRLDYHLCADPSGVATITDGGAQAAGEFIPYTPRALNWHTDGYYQPAERCVRAFMLHCVAKAQQGGANRFFDHELAYIALRDREPRWIEALSQRDVLTIPGHAVAPDAARPAVAGAVFSVCDDGGLHMRYTARKRHVVWKDQSAVLEAIAFLHELLDDPSGFALRYTLQPGEGVVCANVLHSREAYHDDMPLRRRTLLRARYRDSLPVH